MAFDPGAIDSTLAAAIGDDPVLIAELRVAFLDSVETTLVALVQATTAESWCASAWRLKGLAASFGAVRLTTLAGEAVAAGKPDAVLLGRIKRMAARL
ncbi:Hpt domain-containing protein [Sphingomonas sp.]|uniref:Hpt domain-containing protein n=1 Tax=Sphingomonas sp. TaxID=28214 RepID=UPI003CC55970